MNAPPDDPHYHCEPGSDCLGCGEYICPRCSPSPRGDELCRSCYWVADPNDDDLFDGGGAA